MQTYLYDSQTKLFIGAVEATPGDVPGSWIYPNNATPVAPPAGLPEGMAARWNGVGWELVDRAAAEAEAAQAAECETALAKATGVLAATKLLARTAAPSMADATALAVAEALPEAFRTWTAGDQYAANEIITHNGKVYRVVQAATAQEHQPPGAAGMLAVYRPLVLSASGTASDPIPFENGMDAETGKYYSFGGKLYLCKTDMKPCVWNPGTAGLWQWEYVRDL